MNRYLLTFALILLTITQANALEPLRVAFNTTDASTQVKVELYDYGSDSPLYTEDIGTLNADSFGNITFIVGDGVQAWTDIPSTDINSDVVLNIKVGTDEVLFAQYRVDQLALEQAMTGTGTAISESDLGGSGGGVTTVNMVATEEMIVDNDTYETQAGMSANLEANSTYLIRGIYESKRFGGGTSVDMRFNYSGTTEIFYFDNFNNSYNRTGEEFDVTTNFNVYQQDNIEGFIRTADAGTMELQFRRHPGSDNSGINDNTEIIFIKID